jgi:hypothetical protein
MVNIRKKLFYPVTQGQGALKSLRIIKDLLGVLLTLTCEGLSLSTVMKMVKLLY